MSAQQLIINFQDATGWHTNAEYLSDGTAESTEKWACAENNLLDRLINNGLEIPFVDNPMDMMITRVVVIRKSDGAKVCEWPAAAWESGL
jgi:hypothetical protein